MRFSEHQMWTFCIDLVDHALNKLKVGTFKEFHCPIQFVLNKSPFPFFPRPAISPSQHSEIAQGVSTFQAPSLKVCRNYRQAKKRDKKNITLM